MKIQDKEFYTVQEVATRVGLSRIAVLYDIKHGRLKPEKSRHGRAFVISKFALALYLKYRAEVTVKKRENLRLRQARLDRLKDKMNVA